MEATFGASEKNDKIMTDIDQDENFQVILFWPQKEWRNYGKTESRANWQETKKIQIKFAMTWTRMKNNRMPKIMLNYRSNGQRQLERPLKRPKQVYQGLTHDRWWW